MFFDLSIPVPSPASLPQVPVQVSKKNKGKQPASHAQADLQPVKFSPTQIEKIESRIDLLVRLGYAVVAFNQEVKSKVDLKKHVNTLDPLLTQLGRRQDITYLKRLTILLDEDSEKGNGLSAGNAALFAPYDIIALQPTSQANLQNACLTHSQPSSLTAHIISLPLTEPRMPFRIKHTLVRTALKNGAVFELLYTGALAGEDERRNWWSGARELVRVTKGKGVVVSGGVDTEVSLRAPRDVQNLVTLLGVAQNLAHDTLTTTPKSMLIRAQTRKTYRATLSEPTLIRPNTGGTFTSTNISGDNTMTLQRTTSANDAPLSEADDTLRSMSALKQSQLSAQKQESGSPVVDNPANRKRRSESDLTDGGKQTELQTQEKPGGMSRKQRKKMRLANNS